MYIAFRICFNFDMGRVITSVDVRPCPSSLSTSIGSLLGYALPGMPYSWKNISRPRIGRTNRNIRTHDIGVNGSKIVMAAA